MDRFWGLYYLLDTYIKDLFNIIEKCKIVLYADDTLIFNLKQMNSAK